MQKLNRNDVEGIVNACRNEGLIFAIKILRERTNCGLKEAKDAVEACRDAGYRSEPLITFLQNIGFYDKSGVASVRFNFHSGGAIEYDFAQERVHADDVRKEDFTTLLALLPTIQDLLKPLEK